MSLLKSQSIKLSQFAYQLNRKKFRKESAPIVITISEQDKVQAFCVNGLTTVQSLDRADASNLVTYQVSEILSRKVPFKVLHLCLDTHLNDISLRYLALLNQQSIRNLKNPNFNFEPTFALNSVDDFLTLVPVSTEDFLKQILSDLEKQIYDEKYNIVILDGLDKLLAKDLRELKVKQLLETLHEFAQNLGISILFNLKNDFPKAVSPLINIKLTKGDRNRIDLDYYTEYDNRGHLETRRFKYSDSTGIFSYISSLNKK